MTMLPRLPKFASWFHGSTRPIHKPRPRRPLLEPLEDRLAPAIIPTTTFVDEDNGFLGGGTGVSLREAIRYSAAGDTAQLSAGVYNITIPGVGENLGATGDLDVTRPLIINGPATCNAIIDGNGIERVLDVHGVNLMVSNVEIRNGDALNDPSANKDGGGIRQRGAVLGMTVCNRVDNNQAENGGGVALLSGATMRMLNAQVFLNFAARTGGGLAVIGQSTATVDRSAFRTNVAIQGGAISNLAGSTTNVTNQSLLINNVSIADGGGVFNQQSRLNVVQSTIDLSTAIGDGGGIYADGGSMTLTQAALVRNFSLGNGAGVYMQNLPATVQNTTLSTNYSLANGGGIYRVSGGPNTPLNMLHATLTQNIAFLGGGLFTGAAPLPLLHRSLVAENLSWFGVLDDVSGALNPAGMRNVLSSGLYGLPAATNVITPLGLIDVLGSCTGPLGTPAHNLLPGSPAINMPGGAPASLPTDQKGKPRPAAPGTPDTGACETNPAFQPPGREPRDLASLNLDAARLIDGLMGQPWAEAADVIVERLAESRTGNGALTALDMFTPRAETPAGSAYGSRAGQAAPTDDFAFDFDLT